MKAKRQSLEKVQFPKGHLHARAQSRPQGHRYVVATGTSVSLIPLPDWAAWVFFYRAQPAQFCVEPWSFSLESQIAVTGLKCCSAQEFSNYVGTATLFCSQFFFFSIKYLSFFTYFSLQIIYVHMCTCAHTYTHTYEETCEKF